MVAVAADVLGFGFGIWILFGCFEFCINLGAIKVKDCSELVLIFSFRERTEGAASF